MRIESQCRIISFLLLAVNIVLYVVFNPETVGYKGWVKKEQKSYVL